MKADTVSYGQFVVWVQDDMNKDRVLVNRRVFSVVVWCLIFPAILSLVLYSLRRYQIVALVRFADAIVYLPPFLYALYSFWPTIRDLPRVFRKGGIGAMLDESLKEVTWREKITNQLKTDLKLTPKEWSMVHFHLKRDIERIHEQNRYMTVLTAVVLFFMFQFLDLGGTSGDVVYEAGAGGLVKAWVDQFSQWSIQVFSLLLFSALFYLSGLQFQRYLKRYLVCLERVLVED